MCSLAALPLLKVIPLVCGSYYAPVGDCIGEIRLLDHEGVDSLPLVTVLGSAITDHYLRRVLVGHDDCRLGEARPEGTRVVGLQGFLKHTSMIQVTRLVCVSKSFKYCNLRVPGLVL